MKYQNLQDMKKLIMKEKFTEINAKKNRMILNKQPNKAVYKTRKARIKQTQN
jgi:hypothetical protein